METAKKGRKKIIVIEVGQKIKTSTGEFDVKKIKVDKTGEENDVIICLDNWEFIVPQKSMPRHVVDLFELLVDFYEGASTSDIKDMMDDIQSKAEKASEEISQVMEKAFKEVKGKVEGSEFVQRFSRAMEALVGDLDKKQKSSRKKTKK